MSVQKDGIVLLCEIDLPVLPGISCLSVQVDRRLGDLEGNVERSIRPGQLQGLHVGSFSQPQRQASHVYGERSQSYTAAEVLRPVLTARGRN